MPFRRIGNNGGVTHDARAETDDPYLWLEDVTGDDALDWVREHNEPTLAELAVSASSRCAPRRCEVLDTDARIPYVRRRGEYLYNFWRDAANPRGLWRRTTLESYRTDSPDWDVVIDVDELARRRRRELGVGGRRRHRTRPFAGTDQPVARRLGRRGGARIRHAHKGIRRRRLRAAGGQDPRSAGRTETPSLVGTDFGEGSLTESGYPRLVKRWRRGQPLAEAETVFSGTEHRRDRRRRRRTDTGFRADDAEPRASTSSTTRSTSCATTS